MKKILVLVTFVFIFWLLIYAWQFIYFITNQKSFVCFLDVGEGDAELIKLPYGIEVIVDFGPSKEKALKEVKKFTPLLKRRIEIAFLSHPDLDHLRGLERIANFYQINNFFWAKLHLNKKTPDILNQYKGSITNVFSLYKGSMLTFDGYLFKVIWPPAFPELSGTNNNSLVIFLLSPDEKRILFTGDILRQAEKRLVDIYGKDLKADILKFPHHGARSSLEVNFLKAVLPTLTVIEVGRNNRYNHPHSESLEKLKELGSLIKRTDKDSTVCFSF